MFFQSCTKPSTLRSRMNALVMMPKVVTFFVLAALLLVMPITVITASPAQAHGMQLTTDQTPNVVGHLTTTYNQCPPDCSKVLGYVGFNPTAFYAKVRLLQQAGDGHYYTWITRVMEAPGRYPTFTNLPRGNYMVAFDFIRRRDRQTSTRGVGPFYLDGTLQGSKWVEYYWY